VERASKKGKEGSFNCNGKHTHEGDKKKKGYVVQEVEKGRAIIVMKLQWENEATIFGRT
jgi:hypothetical protein